MSSAYKYLNDTVNQVTSFKITERPIYGSSRVGVDNDTIELISAIAPTYTFNHALGAKQYELSNHLGNVLATVSDMKKQKDNNNESLVDYYTADILMQKFLELNKNAIESKKFLQCTEII